MKTRLIAIAILAVAGLGAFPAWSEVTNLVCQADTGLFENNPDNNLGGMDFMPSGTTGTSAGGKRSRALLKFNVAEAIPPGAVASSATLTLNVTVAHGFGLPYDLHRMLKPWVEGGGIGGSGNSGGLGAPAATGEVTWNNRSHPDVPWGTPGGAPDTDFVADVSASANMQADSLTFTAAGLVDDVNLWINSPGANFGWLLKIVTETSLVTASRITSEEAAINRPILTITYAPPPAANPPNIFGLAQNGNALRFSFNGQAGRAYTVDSRLGLGTGWSPLTTISALPADSVVHITNTIAGSEKYYRVRTP